MGDIFKLIGDLGFPIAVALAGGYFVYLTIKLLLGGVLGVDQGHGRYHHSIRQSR
jgi:hypothetical protein